ncbi:Putative PIF1 [Rhizopus microsporus]|nr:Putative PIF1 [Rhizopus microsporus]
MLKVRLANKPDDPLELIPRFTLSTQEGELLFTLARKQFPVKLCFAMTINKSQGQSLKYVGVDLIQSSFIHGQLYVALSRIASLSGISVLLPESSNTTNNVVYPELLLP